MKTTSDRLAVVKAARSSCHKDDRKWLNALLKAIELGDTIVDTLWPLSEPRNDDIDLEPTVVDLNIRNVCSLLPGRRGTTASSTPSLMS